MKQAQNVAGTRLRGDCRRRYLLTETAKGLHITHRIVLAMPSQETRVSELHRPSSSECMHDKQQIVHKQARSPHRTLVLSGPNSTRAALLPSGPLSLLSTCISGGTVYLIVRHIRRCSICPGLSLHTLDQLSEIRSCCRVAGGIVWCRSSFGLLFDGRSVRGVFGVTDACSLGEHILHGLGLDEAKPQSAPRAGEYAKSKEGSRKLTQGCWDQSRTLPPHATP